MLLNWKNLNNIFFSFTIICSSFVYADNIPTVLWNIKGHSLQIKPVSAFGQGNEILSESLEDGLNQNSHILVFAVNKLSLEDFSASENQDQSNNALRNLESFLDEHDYMFLPNVQDPLNVLHKTHCGVQEIVVDQEIDENILKSVSNAIERSCVVVLHIADDGIVPNKDQIKNVFTPAFEKTNRNLIGAFTGVKSSWGPQNEEHHSFRNLLSTELSDMENFANFSNCLIMYAENITVEMKKENVSESLTIPDDLEGSSCGNNSVLQLNFRTSGDLSSVTLIFNFERIGGSWTTTSTLSMTGEKAVSGDIDLDSHFIEAAVGFSFSCGNLLLKAKNDTYKGIQISMERFQIQPFEVKSGFSESFDCVPFFTIPIWMGVFVSVLFIVILNIGVYALFSVNTMDRFDDPKGKTISVSAANE